MSKELEALEQLFISSMTNPSDVRPYKDVEEDYELIKSALERKEKLEKAIKELFSNHIELVRLDNCCYFKIKNSKGCERSYTSKTFEDFWKVIEVLEESK